MPDRPRPIPKPAATLPHLQPIAFKRPAAGATAPRRGAVDIIVSAKRTPRPAATAPAPDARPVPPQPKTSQPTATKAVHRKPRRLARWASILQPFFIIFGAMGLGFAAQSQLIGEGVIALYAIVAIIRRIPSRNTFLLAFLLSLCIMTLLVVKSNNTMAATLAIYLFLLLAVGTVQLGIELRQNA